MTNKDLIQRAIDRHKAVLNGPYDTRLVHDQRGEWTKVSIKAPVRTWVADVSNKFAPSVLDAMSERLLLLELAKTLPRLFALGYHEGHEDTIESRYTHIYECDMDYYFEDAIPDILKEYKAYTDYLEEQEKDKQLDQ